MRLSDIRGKREIVPGYTVEVEPGEHLVLKAGVFHGKAGFRFGLVEDAFTRSQGVRDGVADFKYYRKDGSKYRREYAAREFFFAIPKSEIEIVEERGHRSPHIIIGTDVFTLNVSGGSANGMWTDYIRADASIGFGIRVSTLETLARYAADAPVSFPCMDGRQRAAWVELALRAELPKTLKKGMTVVIRDDYGSGSWPFVETVKQSLRLELGNDGLTMRASKDAVDWTATANANNLPIPEPATFATGNVLKPE